MKKLLFIIFLFIISFLNGQSYIEVYDGSIPVIITCPHGGNIRTLSIDNRDCDTYVCSADLNTIDIGIRIREYLDNTPYLIINNLHRTEIDVNRSIVEACNDKECELYYNSFHNQIENTIKLFENTPILLIDIHGQAHDHGFIELGYNISSSDYAHNINYIPNSSVNNYCSKDLETIIRGKYSLGYYYDKYYDVSPSPKNPIPPIPYFNGGYIIETYSKYKNVVAIQIEIPYKIRKDAKSRDEFAKNTAKIIKSYYKKIK